MIMMGESIRHKSVNSISEKWDVSGRLYVYVRPVLLMNHLFFIDVEDRLLNFD